VVQLGAADGALPFDLDAVDDRRVEREDALDADSTRNLADGERLPHAAAAPRDDDAREHLDAFLLALANLDVDPDAVSGREGRYAALQYRLLDVQQDVGHGLPNPLPGRAGISVSPRGLSGKTANSKRKTLRQA